MEKVGMGITRNLGIKEDQEPITEESPIEKEKKTIKKYETDEGLKLILTETSDGETTVKLEEDLEISDSENKLENLVKILRIIAKVDDVDKKYIPGPKSEENKLVAEITIKGLREFTKLEEERLKEIKLYRNLQKMLVQRKREMERKNQAFPQSTLDDIAYWTHLTVNNILPYKNILSIKESNATKEKLLEIADSLRELYGLIQIKTKVTREQILSDKKLREIAKARHIMMYITKNKFPFLSSSNLGTIFGEIGKSKDHATILLATATEGDEKRFENSVGLRPGTYVKINDAERLYEDAEKKYKAAHNK